MNFLIVGAEADAWRFCPRAATIVGVSAQITAAALQAIVWMENEKIATTSQGSLCAMSAAAVRRPPSLCYVLNQRGHTW